MMHNFKIIISNAAKEDFRNETAYYKKTLVVSLSKRFSAAVKAALLKIQDSPTVYSIRYKNIRIVYTKKFPYALHFIIKEDAVYIIAIIYSAQYP